MFIKTFNLNMAFRNALYKKKKIIINGTKLYIGKTLLLTK